MSNKSGVYFEVPQLKAEDQGVFSIIFNDTDMDNHTYSLTVTGETLPSEYSSFLSCIFIQHMYRKPKHTKVSVHAMNKAHAK